MHHACPASRREVWNGFTVASSSPARYSWERTCGFRTTFDSPRPSDLSTFPRGIDNHGEGPYIHKYQINTSQTRSIAGRETEQQSSPLTRSSVASFFSWVWIFCKRSAAMPRGAQQSKKGTASDDELNEWCYDSRSNSQKLLRSSHVPGRHHRRPRDQARKPTAQRCTGR